MDGVASNAPSIGRPSCLLLLLLHVGAACCCMCRKTGFFIGGDDRGQGQTLLLEWEVGQAWQEVGSRCHVCIHACAAAAGAAAYLQQPRKALHH